MMTIGGAPERERRRLSALSVVRLLPCIMGLGVRLAGLLFGETWAPAPAPLVQLTRPEVVAVVVGGVASGIGGETFPDAYVPRGDEFPPPPKPAPPPPFPCSNLLFGGGDTVVLAPVISSGTREEEVEDPLSCREESNGGVLPPTEIASFDMDSRVAPA